MELYLLAAKPITKQNVCISMTRTPAAVESCRHKLAVKTKFVISCTLQENQLKNDCEKAMDTDN
jgi:hypothetical protein